MYSKGLGDRSFWLLAELGVDFEGIRCSGPGVFAIEIPTAPRTQPATATFPAGFLSVLPSPPSVWRGLSFSVAIDLRSEWLRVKD